MADEEAILDPEIERLSEKLGKDPDSLVFAPLADAYRRSGLIEEAIDVLRKGMEKHPNYASAFIVLGRCYQDQKMYELARSEFEKALDVDPDNFLASKLYAAVLVPLKRKEEAQERYRRLLESDPTNVEVQKALEDLNSEEPDEEEKKDLSSGADMGMFGFGDIDKPETSGGAEGLGGMLPGTDLGGEVSAPTGTTSVEAEPATEATPTDLGGRSPFDFGTIPEAAGAEPEKPEEEVAPPPFLEPTVVNESGARMARHDLGGEGESAKPEVTVPEKEEEVVLPKPTGETAFTAPPGLDVSIGARVDANLAEIYYQNGFPDKAIGVYEKLVEMDPGRDDYKNRLAELKGEPPPPDPTGGVFPSEILEPFSDAQPESSELSREDVDAFSDAATPEGDQTISLSDLFNAGSASGPLGGPPESPHPAQQAKRKEEEKQREKGEQKGGFDSFQSWLDGLGN